MKLHMFALAACLCCSSQAAAKSAPNGGDVRKVPAEIISQKKYPPSSVGVMIQETESGKVVFAFNEDSLFNPASVTKLFTAAIAYDLLGPDHVFSTQVFVDTAVEFGSAVSVRNLYLRGSGDPGFTAERLWLFVEHLYHCGIRKITGNLVIDDFFFDSTEVGPGFDEDTSSRAYQPLISALSMNFNTVAVHCRPAPRIRQPVIVDLFPEIHGIHISALATTEPPGRKNLLDISTSADSGTTEVTVKGAMGIDETGEYSFRKLWQTWEAFGNALVPLFSRRGITFSGKIVHNKVPYNLAVRPPFYEFSSESLASSVNFMFKYSSNFTAEMLFKTFSARRDSVQGSWDRSMALAAAWLKERGLPGTPVLLNGSGMGDINRVSPSQTTSLLRHVWRQKAWFPDYCSALSNAGIDGTLNVRFVNSKLKGMVRAKTGTLNSLGVNSLAGYLLLPGAPLCSFAVFCNRTGHTQFEDWMLQEEILEKAASSLTK